MKAKYLLLAPILFITNILEAQNQISNGDFEFYSTCPAGIGGFAINLAIPWNSASQPFPPYINSCAPSSSCCGIPIQFNVGYQVPRSGNGMALFAAYSIGHINTREYIRAELKDTLIGGRTYCLTFFVNLLNPSYQAIDAIGAYFSDTSISCSGLYCLLNFQPQVFNPIGNILDDTLGWMQISGCFTAVGNERYIYIGNFNTDAETQTSIIGGNAATSYYIDDVSLYEDTSLSIPETQADKSFSTYPNPASKEVLVNSEKEIDEMLLMDLRGNVVFKKQHSKTNDVSDLADGLYLLRCTFKGGEIGFQKLVVLHDK